MDSSRLKQLVICDAGPLIHLDELNCLDLLADFQTLILPDAVRKEVEQHRPEALHHPDLSFQAPNALESIPPNLNATRKVFSLHAGELEGLRIALAHPRSLFLTDDTAARMAAASLQIVVHGTLGILIRAIRRNQRSRIEILKVLEDLPSRSSLHLKRTLLDEVIRQVKDAGN